MLRENHVPVRPGPSLAIAAAVTAVAILSMQVYLAFSPVLSLEETYLGSLLVQGVLLGLIVLAARLERRPLHGFGFAFREPVLATLAFVSMLVTLFFALLVDPGFFFGFGRIPAPPPEAFGYLLLSAPVLALAQVGFFVGYLFRTLARALPFGYALSLSSIAFAIFQTNLPALQGLGGTAVVQNLFQTTVIEFVLGLLLALYFYKARWGLLGPVSFAAAAFALGALLPVGVAFPSWEYTFIFSLIAYGVLLVVVAVALKEPRLQARRYLQERIGPRRFTYRDRTNVRAELRGTLTGVVVVGIATMSVAYGLPTALGTPTPLLAIATGSMVPTLERGTLVVIQHVAADRITVGTIIAFDVACLPAPTVHRVIRIVSSGPTWVFQTKGDANPSQDPCTVPYTDVRGAVVAIVPYLGFLILDPLFAVAVVALILVVSLLWRRGGRR